MCYWSCKSRMDLTKLNWVTLIFVVLLILIPDNWHWVMLVLSNRMKPFFLFFVTNFSSLAELLLYILTKSLKAVELILLSSKKWCNLLLASKTGILFPPHNHRFTSIYFLLLQFKTHITDYIFMIKMYNCFVYFCS